MERRNITDAIVIHCSATPEGREHTVADIRAWHKARGFSDVGYHFIVKLDGEIERGRREDLVGAHCVEGGMNRRSIGICYIGGMDRDMRNAKDTRTEAQKEALLRLTREMQEKYGIPDSRVFGHREFARKACPAFDVRGMLAAIVILVLALCSCSRKVYVPVEREVVRADTLIAVRNEEIKDFGRDTVLIRERGDTVRVEVSRWRWLERIIRDTVREARRDTVREPVVVYSGARTERKGWGWGWWGWIAVGLAVMALMIRRMLPLGSRSSP